MARVLQIQPLTEERIRKFLESRSSFVDIHPDGLNKYALDCTAFLEKVFDPKEPSEMLEANKRVLSNPMDLTTAAQLIANNYQPDLMQLQKQQYGLMAEDYKRTQVGQEFPLKAFAEAVYQLQLIVKRELPEADFQQELACMERHKMVVRREYTNTEGKTTRELWFRHDKISDFFIVQTFMGKDNKRPEEHMGDSRFRGVYFLLAYLLSSDDAAQLREQLIQYAADTKDHTISDTFVQIVRSRR